MESITILNDSQSLKLEKINVLSKRDNERKYNLQKKKEDDNLKLAENEKLDVFTTLFAEKQIYVTDLIENSYNIPKHELPNHFNVISKETSALQKYVAASNLFLRHYDLERCQSAIQELSLKAKLLEDELLPKKKFAFKNKTKPKSYNEQVNSNSQDEIDFGSKYKLDITNCGFFNRNNEILSMTNTELFQKDITLSQLENCTIYLKGSPSTLHLNHLKNCCVFSGPVSTSIFAEDCDRSTFVIACQQLRLHSSKNVNIYLHVTSRAIMEDCTSINVAPYNWTYEEIDNDFKNALLDKTVNNWNSIDDFNWLNEKHSPNWKELDPKDRIVDWNVVK